MSNLAAFLASNQLMLRPTRHQTGPFVSTTTCRFQNRSISVKHVRFATPTVAAAPLTETHSMSDIEKAAQEKGVKAPLVVLKKGKARLFKEGQPIVYQGAIDRVVGRPAPVAGDCVMVSDGAQSVFAWGVINPESSVFRVRLMQFEEEARRSPGCCLDVDALIMERLRAACGLRKAIGLPSDQTDVYRLCNSEGDGLSGLIVDVLGDIAVVASSAVWVERHRAAIMELVKSLTGVGCVVWRPNEAMLSLEGADGAAAALGEEREDAAGAAPAGADERAGAVRVRENGVAFLADAGGQKTGFYADQRDNRAAVAALCRGKRVLDLCCYSGGFAVSAAVHGAAAVTAVDSSAAALELAQQNARLNGVEVEFARSDVKDFMATARQEGRAWDVVVLDPPKLAPSKKALARAANKYRGLNASAMALVENGGLLLSCSCSGAMTQSGKFVSILQSAALSSGRQARILRIAGCGMDHPQSPAYPEGNYLTAVLMQLTR
eukprot:CAMPEP_0177595426 /NCGR_PEP_ID=MMETSP0419_2-20121207/10348_1 /TAXON_ID=582737 /ORGANISM="Tetraselmis sp., Strain GSL018" /LENGTH=491 /DNA_ID=CAMNT_0019086881 /DNA_START=192 /DNA_END=1667 /DNA_ORIENTATION=+